MQQAIPDIQIFEESLVSDESAIPILSAIKSVSAQHNLRIVVLDDDPTGTQTVYGIPLITEWSPKAISALLTESNTGFYILTNSRSLPEQEAIEINREIASTIKAAALEAGCSVLLISRSDSTLRGHFPAELEALETGWQTAFDGFLLMPYFKDGNRITIDSIHYIIEDNQLIPVATTDFAKDPAFPFHHSDLRLYIEEKTAGKINHELVRTITFDQMNQGSEKIESMLQNLNDGAYVVVDGSCAYHAAVFAMALINQHIRGKQFLVRSAASLVQSLFGIQGLKLLQPSDLQLNFKNGGLIIVGSYVSRSSVQLKHLLANCQIEQIEICVEDILEGKSAMKLQSISGIINEYIPAGKSVVVYTSRKYISHGDSHVGFKTGAAVSEALVSLVQRLTIRPSFIIAKGGITSSDIATKGLGIKRTMIAGQLMPGIPVWTQGAEAKFPGMPYIIFPGNVGGEDYLSRMYQLLSETVPESK